MSYATLVLCIVLMLNLILFLVGSPEVNSPMLGVLKAIITGNWNINWSVFFTYEKLIMIGAIVLIIALVSSLISPASTLTGSFATFHTLNVIAISLFITFLSFPNFSIMNIPEPLSTIMNVMFGFLLVVAIIGLLRGE